MLGNPEIYANMIGEVRFATNSPLEEPGKRPLATAATVNNAAPRLCRRLAKHAPQRKPSSGHRQPKAGPIDAMGRAARNGNFVAVLIDGVPVMPQPNDLSRSLVALDQNSTIIAVIEMSHSSWLVAGMLSRY